MAKGTNELLRTMKFQGKKITKRTILARILCLTCYFDNFIDDEKDGREIEVDRESIQTQWT